MATRTVQAAAIYVRVSTSRQEEEGTSLETQEASCRAYCAEHGYPVAAVYRETHTASDLFGRKHLGILRESVRKREVGVVVAHALDRLTRDQAHLGLLLTEADFAGVAIELVTERIEDTPEGRLIQSVRGFAAEIERLKIMERTQRGRVARAAAGKILPGRKAAYGYRWDGPDKARFVIEPEEAAVVRRLFREAIAGTSLRGMLRDLFADGIPSPMGRPTWPPQTLHQILRLPTYSGRPVANRKQTGKNGGGKRTQVLRPESEQIALPEGVAPPIVTPEEQAAAIARLERNKAESARRNPNPEGALLRAGILRCGYCGAVLCVTNDRRLGPRYGCSTRTYGEDHPRITALARLLDAAVWERVAAVLMQPGIIAAEVERQQGATGTIGDDLTAIDRRITAIGARQQRIARAVATLDDDIAAEPLLSELSALGKQRRALDGERAGVAARVAGWEADQERLQGLTDWCDRVAGNLESLTYAEKRDALLALGVQVRLWRTDHDPRWEMTMLLNDIVSTSPIPIIRCKRATSRSMPKRTTPHHERGNG